MARRTVGRWIGFGQDGRYENDNGKYHLYYCSSKDQITISAYGNEKGQNPNYLHWAGLPENRGKVASWLWVNPKSTPPFTITTMN